MDLFAPSRPFDILAYLRARLGDTGDQGLFAGGRSGGAGGGASFDGAPDAADLSLADPTVNASLLSDVSQAGVPTTPGRRVLGDVGPMQPLDAGAPPAAAAAAPGGLTAPGGTAPGGPAPSPFVSWWNRMAGVNLAPTPAADNAARNDPSTPITRDVGPDADTASPGAAASTLAGGPGPYNGTPALPIATYDRRKDLIDRIAAARSTGNRGEEARQLTYLQELNGELAADPWTGTDAHRRQTETADAINKTDTAMMPQSRDFMSMLAQQGAERDAVKEKAVGTVKNALLMDPNYQQAQDLQAKRDIEKSKALYGAKADAKSIPAATMENLSGLNTAELEGVKVLKQLHALGLDTSNDPADPRWNKFVVSTLKIAPQDFNKADIQQRVAYINAVLMRGMMGGRPAQYIAQILQNHLPDGNMSGMQLTHVLENVLGQTSERRRELAHLERKKIEDLLPQGEGFDQYMNGLAGGGSASGLPAGVTVTRR